nr:zinc finger protein [Marseillevirus futianmevirus]
MVFECSPCAFSTFDRSNFNKHLLTTKHKRAIGHEVPPEEKIYECIPCEFSTKNKKDFSRHVETQKHKLTKNCPDSERENFCSLCNFQAKTPKGFESHKETKKHRDLEERETCIGVEKITGLAKKIASCPADKDIVIYLERRFVEHGRTFTEATISYVITTTNVKDEITLFEVYSAVLKFLGVTVTETEDGIFVALWRRKKYRISRKEFLFFVASTVDVFDDRCKDLINNLYNSFRKTRWCTEPLKDKKQEIKGEFVSFRRAKNEKTGDSVAVLASVDGLIRFSEETYKIFQRLKTGSKRKRLAEGFCIWWKKGEKFKKEVEECLRGCSFREKEAPSFEHKTQRTEDVSSEEPEKEHYILRSVTEEQYISFLENFRISPPTGICDEAKVVTFVEKAMVDVIRKDTPNSAVYDHQTSFFSAVLDKKELVKRNIILSFFGFEPRTRFSTSVIEKVRKLQE